MDRLEAFETIQKLFNRTRSLEEASNALVIGTHEISYQRTTQWLAVTFLAFFVVMIGAWAYWRHLIFTAFKAQLEKASEMRAASELTHVYFRVRRESAAASQETLHSTKPLKLCWIQN